MRCTRTGLRRWITVAAASCLLASAAACGSAAAPAGSAPSAAPASPGKSSSAVADFYRGKTVTVIVGTTAGGGLDRDARMLAQYIRKYIPGHPTVIAQDMPGGGGLVANNYVANGAKPDGLTIDVGSTAVVAMGITGLPQVKYDLSKLNFLGSLRSDNGILVARSSFPCKTIQALETCPQTLRVGSDAPGQLRGPGPELLKAALGLHLRMVYGYQGTSDIQLALDRGEVDAIPGSWSAFNASGQIKQYRAGKLMILVQAGAKKVPQLSNVPLASDIVPQAWKPVFKVVNAIFAFTRPVFVAPGTPADRVAALQKAFVEMNHDSGFLAEAHKLRVPTDYADGQQVTTLLNHVLAEPQASRQKLVDFLTSGLKSH